MLLMQSHLIFQVDARTSPQERVIKEVGKAAMAQIVDKASDLDQCALMVPDTLVLPELGVLGVLDATCTQLV